MIFPDDEKTVFTFLLPVILAFVTIMGVVS